MQRGESVRRPKDDLRAFVFFLQGQSIVLYDRQPSAALLLGWKLVRNFTGGPIVRVFFVETAAGPAGLLAVHRFLLFDWIGEAIEAINCGPLHSYSVSTLQCHWRWKRTVWRLKRSTQIK
jgi:hypothetical protein